MTRTVFCKKYKEELEGLISAPFPGEKGEEILNNVSKKACCLLYTSDAADE